jgi:hypothetical protein
MFVSFLEYMSQRLSKDMPQGTNDLRADNTSVEFSGEYSKNKPPNKKGKVSGLNPEKMYGRKKKNELP